MWDTIFVSGIFQGLILILALLSISPRSKSNWLLALLLLLTCVNIALHIHVSSGHFRELPYLTSLLHPLLFLLGPAYYFYIRAIVDPKSKWAYRDLWHLLPFVAFFVYVFPSFFVAPEVLVDKIGQKWYLSPENASSDIHISLSLHRLLIAFYTFVIYKALRAKQRALSDFTMTGFVAWIQKMNIIFGAYWIVSFLLIFLLDLTIGLAVHHFHFVMIFMAIFIYALSYLSITRNGTPGLDLLAGRLEKYKNNSLPNSILAKYLVQIEDYFRTQQPYLDAHLRLNDVAQYFDLPKNTVSQVINSQAKKNFYEFVSEYRHREFKRRLDDLESRAYTIMGLAMDSGYNNKQTAISTFKKYEGCTPSQYLKRRKAL